MRAPLSWLRELTPLSADARDKSMVAELASELDALGLVVEGIDWVGEDLDDVVLVRVLEIAAIEGADRIRRVVVDRGSGETTEVVCGAWNFEVGDVVVLAPVGSVLPGGFEIGRRKMRGVTSNGMLCSGRELALSDDQAGILVLARPGLEGDLGGIELGQRLIEHLGFGPDVVFDLSIEANRPDCLSILGIARDLAARYGLPLHEPEPEVVESDPAASELASIEVADPGLCQRILGRVVTGLSPVASPALVQRRLVLSGLRPINQIVDASNYVMLELGQPTHPYDLDALGGHGLRVRAAHAGETLQTLDGETRILGGRSLAQGDELSALDCLICNANDLPVGIAGVMGGRSSEIADATTRVLLEVARFTPVSIGRTARHVGLRTEASVRYERGVDPEGLERAAARYCELVVSASVAAGLAAPAVARGIVDSEPRRFERRRVLVRPARVNSLLGTALEPSEMLRLLAPIGFEHGEAPERTEPVAAGGEAGDSGSDAIELVVPSFRPDVTREVDVIEEVARTHGYRHIPRTDRRSPYVGRLSGTQALRREVRRVLMGIGAHEAWTSSIVDPVEHWRAGLDQPLVRLANPMVAEESALRAGLLPGLLRVLRYNAGHRQPWLRMFEVGDVFSPPAGHSTDTGPTESSSEEPELRDEAQLHAEPLLPDEHERVALLLAREQDSSESAMTAWRVLADALGLVGIEVRQDLSDDTPAPLLAGLHPTRSGLLVVSEDVEYLAIDASGEAELGEAGRRMGEHDRGSRPLRAGSVIGSLGEIDPDVLASFELPHHRIGWLELDLDSLARAPRRNPLALPVSRFPSSDVDLAFSVEEALPAARVQEVLAKAVTDRLESVELFDVYRGAGLEDGRKSLAYRLRLCALDHTLGEEEVAELRQRCIDAVEAALPASIRS